MARKGMLMRLSAGITNPEEAPVWTKWDKALCWAALWGSDPVVLTGWAQHSGIQHTAGCMYPRQCMCQDAAGEPVLEETSWYLMFRRRNDKVGKGRLWPISCCNLNASFVLWPWVRYWYDRQKTGERKRGWLMLCFSCWLAQRLFPGCDERTRLVSPKGVNAHEHKDYSHPESLAVWNRVGVHTARARLCHVRKNGGVLWSGLGRVFSDLWWSCISGLFVGLLAFFLVLKLL